MAEYLDREAALEICDKEYKERLRMHDYCGDTVAWNIGGAIKELPCADVAPVVRCKDCKYYKISELHPPYKFCFRLRHPTENRSVGYNFADDDFCSHGECREGKDEK